MWYFPQEYGDIGNSKVKQPKAAGSLHDHRDFPCANRVKGVFSWKPPCGPLPGFLYCVWGGETMWEETDLTVTFPLQITLATWCSTILTTETGTFLLQILKVSDPLFWPDKKEERWKLRAENSSVHYRDPRISVFSTFNWSAYNQIQLVEVDTPFSLPWVCITSASSRRQGHQLR